MACGCVSMYSFDFEVNGICYNIESMDDLTAEVTSGIDYVGDIVIPEEVIYKKRNLKVTKIGNNAFYRCWKLTSLVLPSTIKMIDAWAFNKCSGLKKINIPSSVLKVAKGAFDGCSSLEEIIIEDGEDNLNLEYSGNNNIKLDGGYLRGKHIFDDCPLKKIYVGRNLTYDWNKCYGWSPFFNKEFLTSVEIGNQVDFLHVGLFRNCTALTEIIIPNSVRFIRGSAFNGCTNLTNITIGDSVEEMGDYAFRYCSNLKQMIIPHSVEKIGIGCFMDCENLESISIGNKLKVLNDGLFSRCKNLKNIEIGNSLSKICYDVFSKCDNLANIKIHSQTPPESLGGFPTKTYLEAILYIPEGTLSFYQNSKIWKDFWEIREFITSKIENHFVGNKYNESKVIYTTQGTKMNVSREHLPAGIYIQGGKKFIVK